MCAIFWCVHTAKAGHNVSKARTVRSYLLLGAAATHLGIALSVLDPGAFGPWLTVCGLIWLVINLHRFGRLGPDA